MKNNLYFFALLLWIVACQAKQEEQNDANESMHQDHSHHATEMPEGDGNKKVKSPKTSAMAMLDGNHIHIDYSSPSVRGRQIFGGLVAYDEVWVTGAHKATSIEFGEDVMIEGHHIPKGKYGFFTIPSEVNWTIILNKKWDMHLADDYSAEEDILRFDVKPETLVNPVESLTYKVEVVEEDAVVSMAWDTVKISFEIKNHSL